MHRIDEMSSVGRVQYENVGDAPNVTAYVEEFYSKILDEMDDSRYSDDERQFIAHPVLYYGRYVDERTRFYFQSTVIPVISDTSSSTNSMLSLTTKLFIPVEDPTSSCRTEPLSCSSFAWIPISWLNSFRISCPMRPLSTPIGQVWAHRRHKLHRKDSSAKRATVVQLSSISPLLQAASSPPFDLTYFLYNRRKISER